MIKVSLFLLYLFLQYSHAINFRGLNWADTRDNYNSGWVIPSGLLSSDNYDIVQQKSDQIFSYFISDLGANTIRLPINGPSVLESWWDSYSAAIDTAIKKKMNVILGYWEADNSKDGKIDNINEFYKMWEIVINKYKNSKYIYYEIFNEPFGYTTKQWTDIASNFLIKFPQIPQNHIIISGTGYNDHLTTIGNDTRLSKCLLSLHIYAFWNTNYLTAEAWEEDFRNRVGSYYSRAIVSEYGVPMTTGLNFTGSINNDVNIAFMYGVPNQIRAYGMGSIYWPGLRDGDSYSVQSRVDGSSNIQLKVNNPSGVERIQYGYGV